MNAVSPTRFAPLERKCFESDLCNRNDVASLSCVIAQVENLNNVQCGFECIGSFIDYGGTDKTFQLYERDTVAFQRGTGVFIS